MKEKEKKPNIIFIFSDQQRWDTLGCYGQKLDVTPNLDKMAEEGVRFELAFTPQPLCGPGRACIQTGKFATETGCFHNQIALPQDEKTIADWLNVAGYTTGYIGKWHLASSQVSIDIPGVNEKINYHDKAIPLERRGGYKDYWLASDVLEFTSHGYDGYMFDQDMEKVVFPKNRYRADCLTDYGLDFIDSYNQENPFFLFVSYIEPHVQNDTGQYEGPEGSKERFKNFEVPGDLRDTKGCWRESLPDYLGCCHSLDYNVGRIIDQLEKNRVLHNTLIIYTSDHGDHFGTRNRGHKRSSHDSSIRIPMILYGPGFRGGQVRKEPVSLIDLPPTMLESAGINVPSYMRGRPLQVLTEDEPANWKEEIFVQISSTQIGRALRTNKWKYSVNTGENDLRVDPDTRESDVYYEAFLYNLEDDPHERNNLVKSPEYSEIRKELGEVLKEKIKEIEGMEVEIYPRHMIK